MNTYWIKKLKLKPHPEGGFYRETYRSDIELARSALPPKFRGPRSAATAIFFLLAGKDFSAFHRIKSDEIWHFYSGHLLTIHTIAPSGKYTPIRLGNLAGDNCQPQAVIRAGDWFAAELANQQEFALVGCTVAPGFDFADFELGKRNKLCKLFPRLQKLVTRLTRT